MILTEGVYSRWMYIQCCACILHAHAYQANLHCCCGCGINHPAQGMLVEPAVGLLISMWMQSRHRTTDTDSASLHLLLYLAEGVIMLVGCSEYLVEA